MNHRTELSAARRLGQAAGLLALLLLASGCATYQQDTQAFTQATRGGAGGLMAAIPQIEQKAAKSAGSKDELIYRLEHGTTLRTAALADPSLVPSIVPPAPPVKAGEVAPPPPPLPTAEEVSAEYARRSNAAFDLAEEKVNAWEEQAKTKVGAELGAALTNQASLPYRGRAYDKVMMNTYKALNYLSLRDKDKARVELNRSLQRQRDAVADNEKRIAKASEEAAAAARGELKDEQGKSAAYDANRAVDDPKTGPALQAALDASIAPMKPYGDYVNPFAVFLDGLFFTTLGEVGDDWERGRKSFERVASMVPDNAFLQADLAAAAAAAEGKAPEGVTYVIFETGTAPSRDQVRVDIPTFLVTSRLAYVGASFPKLVFNQDYVPALSVTAGDQTVNTATVASMDSVIANDFKNEWPTVVTKTLITTATKAIVQAAVQKAAEDRGGMWAGLAASVIMSGINAATNIADTRTWTSLPKEFQYARVATPASRELTISAGTEQKTVKLVDGSVNVVYVKSSSSSSPLFVSQFALK